MKYRELYPWPRTKEEACSIQDELVPRVSLMSGDVEPRLIAAVDTAYGSDGESIHACAVVTSFPEIRELEKAFHTTRLTFPYSPGLLFFREGPALLGALGKLESDADVIIVHGHGLAHPRRLGQACHVGLAFDKPTVGCARRILAGKHALVPPTKGSSQPIVLDSREVGVAYRSKADVKPVFISPGHLCDIPQARDIVVRNLRGFRLPEPLRLAHLFVNKGKRHLEKASPQRRRRADAKVNV